MAKLRAADVAASGNLISRLRAAGVSAAGTVATAPRLRAAGVSATGAVVTSPRLRLAALRAVGPAKVLTRRGASSWESSWMVSLRNAIGSTPPGTGVDPMVAGADPLGTANYSIPASNVIYLATTGSDANNGAADSPKATIAAAISAVPAGGTIVVRGGTYRQECGTPTKAFTLQNYPGETVWFSGANAVSSWTASGSTWWATLPTVFSHPAIPGGDDGKDGSSNVRAEWPDAVWIDGVRQWHVDSTTPAAGEFYVDQAAGRVYIGTNPSGKSVEVTARVWYMVSKAPVTIRGIGIRRYAANINQGGMLNIVQAGAGTTVENCWITDAGIQGIAPSGDNVTISRVTVTGCGGVGIGGNQGDNAMIDRCLVYRNNTNLWTGAPINGAVKLTRAVNLTIRHSIWWNNPRSNGIWFDQGCGDTKVYGNWIHTNEALASSYAILLELSEGSVIAGNYITGTGWKYGIAAYDSGNANIYNNLVESTQQWDVGAVQDERRNEAGNGWGYSPVDYPCTIREIRLCNNVFLGSSANSGRPRFFQMYAYGNGTDVYADAAMKRVSGNLLVAQSNGTHGRMAGWTDATQTRLTYSTTATLEAAKPAAAISNTQTTLTNQEDLLALAETLAATKGDALPAAVADLFGLQAGHRLIGPPLPRPLPATPLT